MNLFGPFFADYIWFFAKKNLELICSTRLSLIPGSATGCGLVGARLYHYTPHTYAHFQAHVDALVYV
jgi:hypothetical protein